MYIVIIVVLIVMGAIINCACAYVIKSFMQETFNYWKLWVAVLFAIPPVAVAGFILIVGIMMPLIFFDGYFNE